MPRGLRHRGSEQWFSAEDSGLAEEIQRDSDGEKGLAYGILLCTDLFWTSQKVHLWAEEAFLQMKIFPKRLKYLKSCSEPKRHNHLSVQLGPDIKHWHDQRDHQQLQKKSACEGKAPGTLTPRLSMNLPLFFTSPLQTNPHTAIQKEKRNSTHQNCKLILLINHRVYMLQNPITKYDTIILF